MFDKVDGFTRGYSETELLALSYSEKHNAILSRIRYLLSLKRSISYVVSHSYGKNKIPSNGDLPVGKNFYYPFFFYLEFFSETFTTHRAAGEDGGYFFNYSLPFSPASQTLRH